MAITRKDFWQHFGQDRFTKADLWKAFGYNDHPGFPTDDFIARLDLEARPYIEPAAGPRGGHGWRLTAQAVDECTSEATKAQRRHDAFHALAQAIPVAYGELWYLQGTQMIHWRLKLPYEFTRYHGRLKRGLHELSFTIKTTGLSVKKVKAVLSANTALLPAEVEAAVQAEHDFLAQQQSRLRTWQETLAGRAEA